MRKHEDIQALLPFYVSGTLEGAERQEVAEHLQACPACREEVQFWRETSALVAEENAGLAAPRQVMPAVMAQIEAKQAPRQILQTALSLLKAQLRLVRTEIWTSSFLVILIGFAAAVLLDFKGLVYALAPMVASAGVSMIYGKENDPAYELTLAAPVSQAQILLARLALVFGYDLILVSAAYLGMGQFLPEQSMSALLLSWLAPMTFLSAFSLLLSLVFGSANAISAAYLLWLSKFIVMLPEIERFGLNLEGLVTQFWESPALLFTISGVLIAAALLTVGRGQPSLQH